MTYSEKMIVNAHRSVKVPGRKSTLRVKTSPEEQIIVPVPALVSVEVQEEVLKNLQRNQKYAMRNNQQRVPALLRSGLAKCGNCGRTAVPKRLIKSRKRSKLELRLFCGKRGM